MFDTEQNGKNVRVVFSSDYALAHQAVDTCVGFMVQRDLGPQPDVQIVLRELLHNAIQHGNGNAPERRVACCMEHQAGRLCLTVADEGDGFGFEGMDTSIPEDPRSVRNRGLTLVHALSDDVMYISPGNVVRVLIDLRNAEDTTDE
ncbi:MAG: ATP-binding protein [bacterium]|nr:ATP-binding protein [bacterium]